MIGIMNVGDDSIEFYAAARHSSLYRNPPAKTRRTYTQDGRVLIDGVLESCEQPEVMWHDLISKIMTLRLMKLDSMESQASGPFAAIRRLSTKLRLTKTLSNTSDDPVLMTELHAQHRSREPKRRARFTELKHNNRTAIHGRALSAPTRKESRPDAASASSAADAFVTRIEIDDFADSEPEPTAYSGIEELSLLNAVFNEDTVSRSRGPRSLDRDSGRDSMHSDAPSAHLDRGYTVVERF